MLQTLQFLVNDYVSVCQCVVCSHNGCVTCLGSVWDEIVGFAYLNLTCADSRHAGNNTVLSYVKDHGKL